YRRRPALVHADRNHRLVEIPEVQSRLIAAALARERVAAGALRDGEPRPRHLDQGEVARAGGRDRIGAIGRGRGLGDEDITAVPKLDDEPGGTVLARVLDAVAVPVEVDRACDQERLEVAELEGGHI